MEKEGEKEKRMLADTCKKEELCGYASNNFWIRIMQRNGFLKLVNFSGHFTLKEGNLKFTKGFPPRVANFNAISVWTHERGSSIYYAWGSALEN